MKSFFTLIVLTLLFSTVSAQGFENVYARMFSNGLTTMESESAFRPSDTISRGEVAKLFNGYAKLLSLTKNKSAEECQFNDIDGYDETLIPHIIEACEYGLIKGSQGNYFPNNQITDAEVITVIIRTTEGMQDETSNPRWQKTFEKAKEMKIIDNETVWDLEKVSLRGKVGTWLRRAHQSYTEKDISPKSLEQSLETLYKPVIYLYPEQKQTIQVQLDYQGKIVADYPKYDEKTKGWQITAYPDGKIINHADQQEYSYLFWEGIPKTPINWDLSKGFVVKGEDTKEFLQKKLSEIGLTPREYNEFIVYWFPQMQVNPYNLIHFADKQYTDNAPLTIYPKPDSLLRVFMVFKPLKEAISIEQQIIKPFYRNGFSVIEWGGTITTQ